MLRPDKIHLAKALIDGSSVMMMVERKPLMIGIAILAVPMIHIVKVNEGVHIERFVRSGVLQIVRDQDRELVQLGTKQVYLQHDHQRDTKCRVPHFVQR